MMNDSPAMPHHADLEALAHALEIRADAFRQLGFNAVEIAAMVRGSAWRPIESAPKDGRDVLLYDPEFDEIVMAFYCDSEHAGKRGRFVWVLQNDNGVMAEQVPTHWMPRPSSPESVR